MIRFVHGKADVRVSAGREQHIRTLQPLSLEICNSLFLGDYLTSEGQPGADDLRMLTDGGYVVLGAEDMAPTEIPKVAARKRGAGTTAPANA